VLELLDAKEKILVGFSVREPCGAQASLHRGVYEGASPRRVLACPAQNVLNHGAPFFTLHPALLDQSVNGLLNPVAGGSSSAYL
jgi:hypothetical protein